MNINAQLKKQVTQKKESISVLCCLFCLIQQGKKEWVEPKRSSDDKFLLTALKILAPQRFHSKLHMILESVAKSHVGVAGRGQKDTEQEWAIGGECFPNQEGPSLHCFKRQEKKNGTGLFNSSVLHSLQKVRRLGAFLTYLGRPLQKTGAIILAQTPSLSHSHSLPWGTHEGKVVWLNF